MAKLILSLDMDDVFEARQLMHELDGLDMVKVNHLLMFHPGWPVLLKYMADRHMKCMVDLKLADIPSTTANVFRMVIDRMSVHTWANAVWQPWGITVREYPEACMNEVLATDDTKIIYVPKLTSQDQEVFNCEEDRLGNFDGIVCSAATALRNKEKYPDVDIIVPGFRLKGDGVDDHRHPHLTPWGADYVVVGRPIIESDDVYEAYHNYKDAIEAIV